MRVLLVTGFYPGQRMGGAEYQTALLGQGLVRKGHDVTFLAVRAERTQEMEQDGMRLHELPGWHQSGRTERHAQIAKVMDDAQPDVCYVRLLTELDGISRICQARGIPVVSVSCSLKETTPFLTGYDPRETIGYWRSGQTFDHFRSFMAIRRSAAHVCNTYELRDRVKPWLPGKRVDMIYNGSPEPPPAQIHHTPGKQVIWVNNFKRGKRPELFIELARRLPDFKFVMIGAIRKEGRYGVFLRDLLANGPANLDYLGALPVEEVNQHIGQSDLLVYTSKKGVEGFGNSFLQAWFRSVPTCSLSFELDGILERERVGKFSNHFDEFVDGVRFLMKNPDQRMAMGQRARDYALQNYQVETMVDQYEALFMQTAAFSGATIVHPAHRTGYHAS